MTNLPGFHQLIAIWGKADKGFKFASVLPFPSCRGLQSGNEGRQERKALQKKKPISGPTSAGIREEIKILEITVGGSLSF